MCHSGNKVRFEVVNGGSSITVDCSNTLSTATWYHVVAWHNASANQVGIAVNAGTATTQSYSGGVAAGAGNFVIGARAVPDLYYDGRVDLVGLWKRVLTSQERTDLYNGGAGLDPTQTDVTVTPSGIASAQAFGTAVLGFTLEPTGVSSSEAFGSPAITNALTLLPDGISSGEAFGTAVLTGLLTLEPTGISTGEAFGTAVITGLLTLEPTGISSGEAFGTAAVGLEGAVLPSGVSSSEAFGTAALTLDTAVLPEGISTGEAFGTAAITGELVVAPTGWNEGAFGTPTLFYDVVLLPSGITSGEAFGTASVSSFIPACLRASLALSGVQQGNLSVTPRYSGELLTCD